MIRVTIKEAAKRRGYENAHQFGLSIGVAKMVARRIWDNEQDPKLRTLDKICNAWGCKLEELISYTPGNGRSSAGPQRRVNIKSAVKKTKAAKSARSKRS